MMDKADFKGDFSKKNTIRIDYNHNSYITSILEIFLF